MDRFTELRNHSLKRKPIAPQLTPMLVAKLVPVAQIPGFPSDKLPPGDWYGPSYAPPAGVIWITVVEGQDIALSCKAYLEFLERVVAECEAKFGDPEKAAS